MLRQVPLPRGRRGIVIVALHLGICWLPVIDHFAPSGLAMHLAYCVSILAAYFAIWRLMSSSNVLPEPSAVRLG